MNLKTIRNLTNTPQMVVYKGQQIVLGPASTEVMDEGLADCFLDYCSGTVEPVEETTDVYDPESNEDVVWIANMTGDPSFSEKIKTRQLIKKQWVDTELENPAKTAHAIELDYEPGEQAYTGRDGSYMTRTLPPYKVVIPPHKRRPFKKAIGEWFLRRVASSGPGYNQVAIRSRRPGSFEPDMTWSLEELRAYLKLISADKEKELGPDTAELQKQAKKEKMQFESQLRSAKASLLERIFYYVARPAFRQPTRTEFSEFMTGKPTEELNFEEAEKLLNQAEEASAS